MVKLKPGQQLQIVNQLYPYTVQFKEDLTGNRVCSKRPCEPASEEGEQGASSIKVPRQAEKDPSSVSQGESTSAKVSKSRNAIQTVKKKVCVCVVPYI